MSYCGSGGTINATDSTCNASTVNLYTKADFQEIVVDSLGYAGASFVSWVDLIVLLIVIGFIVGIFMKLGNLFK
jgi:hypothetical protein